MQLNQTKTYYTHRQISDKFLEARIHQDVNSKNVINKITSFNELAEIQMRCVCL